MGLVCTTMTVACCRMLPRQRRVRHQGSLEGKAVWSCHSDVMHPVTLLCWVMAHHQLFLYGGLDSSRNIAADPRDGILTRQTKHMLGETGGEQSGPANPR
jgi:hypothetical protein